MKTPTPLLRAEGLELLRHLACQSLLLAFDFDGTLAPLVPDRALATLRPRTASLLRRLAQAYPVVVISGRAPEDLAPRLRGLGLKDVIAHSGLSPLRRLDQYATQIRLWKRALALPLSRLAGVELEDKRYTLSVHYRGAPSPSLAEQGILDAAAALDNVRVIRGKHVVSLVPDGGPHKGMALVDARARLGCEAALYVGDDASDEEVFALEGFGQVVGVRVGAVAQTGATYTLTSQEEVDLLLGTLCHLRLATDRLPA